MHFHVFGLRLFHRAAYFTEKNDFAVNAKGLQNLIAKFVCCL